MEVALETGVMQPAIKRIIVACGNSRVSAEEAVALIAGLPESRGIDLMVSGGESGDWTGQMELGYPTIQYGERLKIRFFPHMLMPQEITGETDLEAGANMHHRQAENAYHFTVLIALPGAYEKLEDLLWLLPSAPLDVHPKPVGLLNVNGCYDKVLAAMDRGVKTGFISAKSRGVVVSAPTAEELLKKLKEHVLRLAEESNQFRPEMQLRQDFYWQVPFEVENYIDTEVDNAASDFKNANVGLKRTVALLKLAQNFRIKIALLCCILGMAAYLCNVLKK